MARGTVGGALVEGAGGRDRGAGRLEAGPGPSLDLAECAPPVVLAAGDATPVRGGPRPDEAEIARYNWEEPPETVPAAWQYTVGRYEASHQEMVDALKTADRELERFLYHLFHNSYHIGQIMHLRALQDFAPIE